MEKVTLDLASPADDPAIRRLLAANAVPGSVTLTYEREPNYFLGCPTMGPFYQVVVGRHRPDGALAGLGCRASRPRFVNGRAQEVGYLGQLRLDKRFQGRWLLGGGFRFLRRLDADGRVSGYITTIIEQNAVAEGVLVRRPRPYLPLYREAARLCTASLIIGRPKTIRAYPYHIRRGRTADLADIVSFLQQQGRARQFFPVYTEQDFVDSPVTLDFRVEDLVVACRGSRIVGLAGLWDQSRYKQSVVRGYTGYLRWLRLLYNAGARLAGARPLPAPGQSLHFAYASFICVAGNDPLIFNLLLRHLYNLAAERGYAYLMVGLCTSDPLLAVARSYFHIPYYSRLYTVCWPGQERFHEQLDGRPPYLEIASL